MKNDWTSPDGQSASKPIHVAPLNALREHDLDSAGLCPCLPRIRKPEPVETEDGLAQPDMSHAVIVHNAYDRREVGEVCRRVLDSLGKDLATHGHMWTKEQREDYEHALLLLEMHWPEKPKEAP